MREWGGNGRARGATQKCHSWRPLSVCPSHFARAGGLEGVHPNPKGARARSLALTSSSSTASIPTWVSSSPLEAKTNFHGNGRNQFGVRHREKTRAHDGTSEGGREGALCGAAEKGQSLAGTMPRQPARREESGSTWERHPSIHSAFKPNGRVCEIVPRCMTIITQRRYADKRRSE